MASNLEAMGSNLLVLAMASNLLAMASNLYTIFFLLKIEDSNEVSCVLPRSLLKLLATSSSGGLSPGQEEGHPDFLVVACCHL